MYGRPCQQASLVLKNSLLVPPEFICRRKYSDNFLAAMKTKVKKPKKSSVTGGPYRKVATVLCRGLYAATKNQLESADYSFAGFCRVRDELVAEEIPRVWPGLGPKTLARIALGMPAVSYLAEGGERRRDLARVLATLREEIPVGAKAIAQPASGRSKSVSKQS